MSEPHSNVEILPRQRLTAGAPIRPIVPTTIEEAFRMAQWVCAAQLAPDSYGLDEDTITGGQEKCQHKWLRNECEKCGAKMGRKGDPDPQKVVIGILKSCEVGLPPITGLSTIAIIRKRPSIWGDGAVALVQQQGLVEKIDQLYEGVEGDSKGEPGQPDFPDNYTAVFRIWRRGHANPYEGRFSVRDAKRARLWNDTKKQPWQQYPKRMLLARARAYALREGFADALSGLSIREEIEDLPADAAPRPDSHILDDAPPGLPAPTEQPMEGVSVPTEIDRQTVEQGAQSTEQTSPREAAPTGVGGSDDGESACREESGTEIRDEVAGAPPIPELQRRGERAWDWNNWAAGLERIARTLQSIEAVQEFRARLMRERNFQSLRVANRDLYQFVLDALADRERELSAA